MGRTAGVLVDNDVGNAVPREEQRGGESNQGPADDEDGSMEYGSLKHGNVLFA
jgi:hypothetical protein